MSQPLPTRVWWLLALLCVVSALTLYLRALQPKPAFEPAIDLREAQWTALPSERPAVPLWLVWETPPPSGTEQANTVGFAPEPMLGELLRLAGAPVTLQPCAAVAAALNAHQGPPLLMISTSTPCQTQLSPRLLEAYVQAGGALVVVGVDLSWLERFAPLLGVAVRSPSTSSPQAVSLAPPVAASVPVLPRLPVFERVLPTLMALPGTEPRLLALDQMGTLQPRVFERRLGAGKVLLWALPLAEGIRETRQGPDGVATGSSGMSVPVQSDAVQASVFPDHFTEPSLDQLLHTFTLTLEGLTLPLPTVWPFLTPVPAALILTSDQDFAPAEFVQFQVDEVERAQGELTLFLTGMTRRQPSDGPEAFSPDPEVLDQLPVWQGMFHGISVHPNANGLPRAREPLRATVAAGLQQLERCCNVRGRTIRHHFLFWWPEAAEDLARLGVLMELNLVSIRPDARLPGFITGSGLPLPFVRPDGRPLPLFQQPTQVEDDVLLSTMTYSAGLSPAEATTRSQWLIEQSPAWGTAITANIHPLYAAKTPELLRGMLASAQRRGIPIVSAERWLELHLRRQQVTLSGLKQTPGVLTGALELAQGPLWLRIPIKPDKLRRDAFKLNGEPLPFIPLDPRSPLPGVLVSIPSGRHTFELHHALEPTP